MFRIHLNKQRYWFLLSLFCFLNACAKTTDGNKNSEESLTPVRVHTITREDISDELTYVTNLRAFADVKIYSTVPDRILYFPWQDGDYIERGQRVALIRKSGLDKGLEQLVAQAEALDVQIKNAASEVERNKSLLEANSISRQLFDQVQTQYLSLQAQRRALEASRDQLAITAGNAIITAPISGVIASKMLEVGDIAMPQVPLCQILSIAKLKATLNFIESDINKVKIGQKATIHFDAYPKRSFAGVISTIMPFLDPGTLTNTVEITIDNPIDETSAKRLLKPGMFGRAIIVVAKRSQVIVVPEEALLLDNSLLQQQDKNLRLAFVVHNKTAQQRVVQLGARKGSKWEIKQGVEAGEQIIIRGHHALKDGQEIKIDEKKQP
ncbi:MAG: efflux RND transporter periplasmic adaptor subunit [Deltaproteobacteria bacterium]|nr:efflux RND transporter periplasmic adaptor subunit [Deltaproteobacteria bacterium]